MFLLAQINRKNNSFQKMYDMLEAKVDRLAGKIYFVKKKKKIMDNFSDMLTLEGAGGHPDDTRSIFRVPLKTLGYNAILYVFFNYGQNGCCHCDL